MLRDRDVPCSSARSAGRSGRSTGGTPPGADPVVFLQTRAQDVFSHGLVEDPRWGEPEVVGRTGASML